MVKESIPKEGENIKIQSYKHDGNIHRVWSETTILKGTEHVIIGGNDHTLVTEVMGVHGLLENQQLCTFILNIGLMLFVCLEKMVFIIIVIYLRAFACDEEALKYIDYDLDIKVYPNGKYHLLDEDEYEQHMNQMNYPHDIDIILRRNVDILQQWIEQKGAFCS